MNTEELLAKAKRDYPIGTIFNNYNLDKGCRDIKVIGITFVCVNGDIIINRSSTSDGINYTVYCSKLNRWAEIDSSPKPKDVVINNYDLY